MYPVKKKNKIFRLFYEYPQRKLIEYNKRITLYNKIIFDNLVVTAFANRMLKDSILVKGLYLYR